MDTDYEQRMVMGARIDEARKRQGWTLTQLADKAGYDERTIRNVIHGKATRIKTVFDICKAANIDPNQDLNTSLNRISTEKHGSYNYMHYDDYVGHFFGYRRSYSYKSNIIRSLYSIMWSDASNSLLFKEAHKYKSHNIKRMIDYSQEGQIYISNTIGLLHFVTIHEGAVRLITLTKMRMDDMTMHGVVLTQAQRAFYYQPSVSPIALQKAQDETEDDLMSIVGPMTPDSEDYERVNGMLCEIENNIGIFAISKETT